MSVDRDEDRCLAVGGECIRGGGQRGNVDLEEPGPTDPDPMRVDDRRDAATGGRHELGCRRDREAAGLDGLADDRVGQGMLGEPLGRGDQGEDLVVGQSALGSDDVGDPRLALGEGAGLVEDDGPDRPQPLEGFGVPEQDAGLGALPGPDHDRGRRRETECAWAGDDQDRDRVEQGEIEGRGRAEQEPDDERRGRQPQDRGHEVSGDEIGQALDGRSGALGLRHQADDPGEHGAGADPGGPKGEGARGVQGAADDQILGVLGDGQALARDHAFVDARRSVSDDAIDRDRLARSNPDDVPDANVRDRQVDFRPVAEHAGGSRREIDQAPDGVRGVAACPGLEEPPEQDQGDDRGCGVEVQGKGGAVHPEPGRPEERRDDDRRDRVGVGGGSAHRDQGVHVRSPVAQCLPGADVERPAGPELDGRGQPELEERVGEKRRQERRDGHAREAQQERHRERRRDDDPTTQPGDMAGRCLVALRPGFGDLGKVPVVGTGRGLLEARDVACGVDRSREVPNRHLGWVKQDGR